ncbi:hypothetical protein BaRGS_00029409 [Batillaria attramentaria]|uniref:Poly [ADP-ribose] polymerase n=1 Tax=Batillaria attramentaria TaxID=370345 RepID=A0ABD0JW95_9CAEN
MSLASTADKSSSEERNVNTHEESMSGTGKETMVSVRPSHLSGELEDKGYDSEEDNSKQPVAEFGVSTDSQEVRLASTEALGCALKKVTDNDERKQNTGMSMPETAGHPVIPSEKSPLVTESAANPDDKKMSGGEQVAICLDDPSVHIEPGPTGCTRTKIDASTEDDVFSHNKDQQQENRAEKEGVCVIPHVSAASVPSRPKSVAVEVPCCKLFSNMPSSSTGDKGSFAAVPDQQPASTDSVSTLPSSERAMSDMPSQQQLFSAGTSSSSSSGLPSLDTRGLDSFCSGDKPSSEFELLDDEYMDRLLGKLDLPEPESWLQPKKLSEVPKDAKEDYNCKLRDQTSRSRDPIEICPQLQAKEDIPEDERCPSLFTASYVASTIEESIFGDSSERRGLAENVILETDEIDRDSSDFLGKDGLGGDSGSGTGSISANVSEQVISKDHQKALDILNLSTDLPQEQVIIAQEAAAPTVPEITAPSSDSKSKSVEYVKHIASSQRYQFLTKRQAGDEELEVSHVESEGFTSSHSKPCLSDFNLPSEQEMAEVPEESPCMQSFSLPYLETNNSSFHSNPESDLSTSPCRSPSPEGNAPDTCERSAEYDNLQPSDGEQPDLQEGLVFSLDERPDFPGTAGRRISASDSSHSASDAEDKGDKASDGGSGTDDDFEHLSCESDEENENIGSNGKSSPGRRISSDDDFPAGLQSLPQRNELPAYDYSTIQDSHRSFEKPSFTKYRTPNEEKDEDDEDSDHHSSNEESDSEFQQQNRRRQDVQRSHPEVTAQEASFRPKPAPRQKLLNIGVSDCQPEGKRTEDSAARDSQGHSTFAPYQFTCDIGQQPETLALRQTPSLSQPDCAGVQQNSFSRPRMPSDVSDEEGIQAAEAKQSPDPHITMMPSRSYYPPAEVNPRLHDQRTGIYPRLPPSCHLDEMPQRNNVQTERPEVQQTVRYPDLSGMLSEEADEKREPAKREEEADENQRTVEVTGLTEEHEEICGIYFENKKRSSGGDIDSMTWDKENQCFLITFTEASAAERVASREHTLQKKTVHVQLYTPPVYHDDRVLLKGVPAGTTEDLLQNYLECTTDITVTRVNLDKTSRSAIVMIEPGPLDLKHIDEAFQANPLDSTEMMSVHGVPKVASSTILVENLKPSTTSECISMYFQNRKRNRGGPVRSVKKLSDTTALVHFEECEESVVQKTQHSLDGQDLQVTLHQQLPGFGRQPPMTDSSPKRMHNPEEPMDTDDTASVFKTEPGHEDTPKGYGFARVSAERDAHEDPARHYDRHEQQHQQDYTARSSQSRRRSSGSSDEQIHGQERTGFCHSGQPERGGRQREIDPAEVEGNRQPLEMQLRAQPQGHPTRQPAKPPPVQGSPHCPRMQPGYGIQGNQQYGPVERGYHGQYGHPQTGDPHYENNRREFGAQGGQGMEERGQRTPAKDAYCSSGRGHYWQSGHPQTRNPNSGSNRREYGANGGRGADRGQRAPAGMGYGRGHGHDQRGPYLENASSYPTGQDRRANSTLPGPMCTVVKLGAPVIEQIQEGHGNLRELVSLLKNKFNARYQWKPPDHIIVKPIEGNVSQTWAFEVQKALDKFVLPVKVKLGEGMGLNRSQKTPPQVVSFTPHHPGGKTAAPHTVRERSPRQAEDEERPVETLAAEDSIKLKPHQIRYLDVPQTIEKIETVCSQLQLSLDREAGVLKMRAVRESAQRAKTHVLTILTNIVEDKIPVTEALYQMYSSAAAQEKIQEVTDASGMICYWELQENCIWIVAPKEDIQRLKQVFNSTFIESRFTIDDVAASVIRSNSWQEFMEHMQQGGGGQPPPMLMPDLTRHVIIICDTPSNIARTRAAIAEFFDENKPEEKTFKFLFNHMKFLSEFCAADLRAVHEKAKELGVSLAINKNGAVTKGPRDGLARIGADMQKLVNTIVSDKMTFKTHGATKYLKGQKGQDFLQSTGQNTKCLVTLSNDQSSDDASLAAGTNRVLAQVDVSPWGKLVIMQGDITQCQVGAIVNAANGRLEHGGGVAAAIVDAGGPSIQEESRDIVLQKGTLRDGEVVATGAGTLRSSHVLHAVGPTWKGGFLGEDKTLTRTVMESLKLAQKLELSSLAMPAISCGIFRFPVQEATHTIVRSVVHFLGAEKYQGCLNTVILIDRGSEPLKGFLIAARKLIGEKLQVLGEPSAPRQSWKDPPRPSKHSDAGERRSHSSHSSEKMSTSDLPVRVIPGEIAKSKADVIVSTVHPSLDLRKGVLSKSILEAGGDAIQQELQSFVQQHGRARRGGVVKTQGGNLKCRSVFHLSLPTWNDDRGETMRSSVKQCLDLAKKVGAKTIAFPALGTGKLGYPGDEVASIMFGVFEEWFGDNRGGLREAQVVVYPKDAETLQAFKNPTKGGGGHRGHSDHRGHRDRDRDGAPKSVKTSLGRLTVMVKQGNILSETCDAIVNSSNDALDLRKGAVSKSILEACGDDILLECRRQKNEMEETGVAATPVDSTSLNCSTIIHVSADRFKKDWQEGTLQALRMADRLKLRSVALPALGTSMRGADPQQLAKAMKAAISKFSTSARSVKEVRLILFQQEMVTYYVSAFKRDASPRGAEAEAAASDSEETEPVERREEQSTDIYIYSTKQDNIKAAQEKIYRHMKANVTERKIEDSLITNLRPDQAISDIKDIMMKATTERLLAAGMPPVRWQYEAGKDKFHDFDPDNVITIEAAYKKREKQVEFSDKRGKRYRIVFKEWKEYSLGDKHASPVRVRRRDLLQEKSQEIPLPSHWEPMKGDKVKLVDLKPSSPEYKRVAENFGGQTTIKKIQRVQNPTLFQQFKVKKRELEQFNPKGTVNEKRLWHGTSSDVVTSIITNGFNRSYCGKNRTALGAGVYFAANAAVSMGYATGGNMFQTRVLTGEYTQGNGSMRMAPMKPSGNRPYDSVTDGGNPPGVHVIFHDSQAYPEYLLTL